MDMAVAEARSFPRCCPLASEESYTPLLQESIHHLLQQLRAGASDFSHFQLIFSRLVQTAPSPPVEIIWFYGAVNFQVRHQDPTARLAELRDLFHLLVAACSESFTALKRVAVLAPLVPQLYNLLAPSLNSCLRDEIASLLERIVSFISMCCCSGVFAHDDSPALQCCFPDSVRVWTFEWCEQGIECTDHFKLFFPAVSEGVRDRLREGCGVGYLAGAVMFQCFLLRLSLNLASHAPQKVLSVAGDMLSAFRSCYFLGKKTVSCILLMHHRICLDASHLNWILLLGRLIVNIGESQTV